MALKSHESYANKAGFGADVREYALIDANAAKINAVLNPIDSVAAKKVVGESIKIVNDMKNPGEWQADNVQSLIDTVGDPQRVANKAVAERRLRILTDAAFIAIKFGDNVALATALDSGSAQNIDDLLPAPLKGLGERVRNVEIKNEKIRTILNGLDKKGRVLKGAGESGKVGLKANLNEALVQLSDVDIADGDDRGDDEVMRVSAYFDAEIEALGGNATMGGGAFDADGIAAAMANAMTESQAEATRQTQMLEARSGFANFTEKILEESPFDHLLDQEYFYKYPQYVEPAYAENEVSRREWRRILDIGLAAQRHVAIKRGGQPADKLFEAQPSRANLELIKENEMSEMISREPAFREAARQLFGKFFEQFDGKLFPNSAVDSRFTADGRFFIRTKSDFDSGDYINQMRLVAEDLVAKGLCDRNMATIFTATASHILIDASNAVDSADWNRTHNNRTPDPDRFMIHPLSKLIIKSGFRNSGEVADATTFYQVGGKLGSLTRTMVLVDRARGTRDFTAPLLDGKWGYVPALTGCSWTELTPVTITLKEKVALQRQGQPVLRGGQPVMVNKKETVSVAEWLIDPQNKYGEDKLATDHTKMDLAGREIPDVITIGRGGDDHFMGKFIRDIWPAMIVEGMAFKGKLAMKDAGKEMEAFLEEWCNKRGDLIQITVPKGGSDVQLLGPWINDPRTTVGILLNVINRPLLNVRTPILPDNGKPYVYQTRDVLTMLTSYSDDEIAGIREVLLAPYSKKEHELIGLALADMKGLTAQARARKRLEEESIKNNELLM